MRATIITQPEDTLQIFTSQHYSTMATKKTSRCSLSRSPSVQVVVRLQLLRLLLLLMIMMITMMMMLLMMTKTTMKTMTIVISSSENNSFHSDNKVNTLQ